MSRCVIGSLIYNLNCKHMSLYISNNITMNDNLSFLLKEWTNRIKCAVESKYLVPLWWIVMQLSVSMCVVGSLICNQNDNYMSYWRSYFYSVYAIRLLLLWSGTCTACGRSYLCSYKVLSHDVVPTVVGM